MLLTAEVNSTAFFRKQKFLLRNETTSRHLLRYLSNSFRSLQGIFKKVSWLCIRSTDGPLASRFIAVISVFTTLLNDPTKSFIAIQQCPLISILSSLPIPAYRIAKTLILNLMKLSSWLHRVSIIIKYFILRVCNTHTHNRSEHAAITLTTLISKSTVEPYL